MESCTSSLRRLVASSLALFALAGCRDTAPVFNEPSDSGTANPTLCSTREDCAGKGICVGGVCEAVTACQTDMQCTAQGKICHQSRGYCVACDGRMGQCGANETCQFDFTCVPIGGNRDGGTGDAGMCMGACADRTECSIDLVCRAGSCCPPPSRCSSPEQCPASRPLCNGATGECFGGDSCTIDSDCSARTGCSGNRCFCNKPMGAATGSCAPRPDECMDDRGCYDSASNMYNGRFCTLLTSPRTCAPAPNCVNDSACATSGLVCDLTAGSPSNGRCVNGTACPMGNECTASQACVMGVCAAKSCLNTPNFCTGGETCNMTTGQCVPQSMGCQRDTDCQAGNYCDVALNRCASGCRDSADCGGSICNAQHQCETSMGGLCATCMTDGDCPSGTSCHENIITMEKRCQEPCSAFTGQDCVINPAAACVFVWCSCIGI